jgi:hypothetical protein
MTWQLSFLASYEPGHERNAVATYGHYILGSISVKPNGGAGCSTYPRPTLATPTRYRQRSPQGAVADAWSSGGGIRTDIPDYLGERMYRITEARKLP